MTNQTTFRQRVVLHNDKELWTESFGDPKNPALILIMGSGGQGIFWPQLFCEQLADQSLFIIRYDHRDTGLSFSVNFDEEPYNLLDMAKDITHIMDAYQIQTATLLGASMGGVIASMLAGYFPERVNKLALLMTTPDLRASFDAYQGLPARSKLSKPADHILQVAKEMIAPPQTWEEKIALFFKCTYLNNGKTTVDEEWLREIALQNFVRQKNPQGPNNHYRACMISYDLHEEALSKIKAPTLILHGDSDPIFPIDHAYALQKAIPQSNLVILDGFGHGLTNAIYFEQIIDNLTRHFRASGNPF